MLTVSDDIFFCRSNAKFDLFRCPVSLQAFNKFWLGSDLFSPRRAVLNLPMTDKFFDKRRRRPKLILEIEDLLADPLSPLDGMGLSEGVIWGHR